MVERFGLKREKGGEKCLKSKLKIKAGENGEKRKVRLKLERRGRKTQKCLWLS